MHSGADGAKCWMEKYFRTYVNFEIICYIKIRVIWA